MVLHGVDLGFVSGNISVSIVVSAQGQQALQVTNQRLDAVFYNSLYCVNATRTMQLRHFV